VAGCQVCVLFCNPGGPVVLIGLVGAISMYRPLEFGGRSTTYPVPATTRHDGKFRLAWLKYCRLLPIFSLSTVPFNSPYRCNLPQRRRHRGYAFGSFAMQVPKVSFQVRQKYLLKPGRSIPNQKVNLTCDDLSLPSCYLAWSASFLCRCTVVTSKTTLRQAPPCRPGPPLPR